MIVGLLTLFPSRRTHCTWRGAAISLSSAAAFLLSTTRRETFIPPPVEPAHAPKNIRINIIIKYPVKYKTNALKYREKFLGKTLEVLIEKNIDGRAFGHTSNYLEVEIFDKNIKANDIVKVKIEKIGYPVSRGVLENV